jgi:hypothetical protein
MTVEEVKLIRELAPLLFIAPPAPKLITPFALFPVKLAVEDSKVICEAALDIAPPDPALLLVKLTAKEVKLRKLEEFAIAPPAAVGFAVFPVKLASEKSKLICALL